MATEEKLDGALEITLPVDFETMPLHVRAGAVIPLGPVKQWVELQVDEPLTLTVSPGTDGSSSISDDDGRSFAYRRAEFMRIEMAWRDATPRAP